MADLNQLCEDLLARRSLILASNRGPVEHHMTPEGRPEARRGSGSLVTALGSLSQITFRQFLDQHQMLDFFDVLTFSDEVRLAKPSDEIFLLTLRELGAEPSESVHVGDHIRNDVIGAKQVGMKTVWIEGFYERPEDSGPEADPDATVAALGLVPSAVQKLTRI